MRQSQRVRSGLKLAAFLAVTVLASVATTVVAPAQQKAVTLGITLPLTGADADDAAFIKNGFMTAIEEANAKGGVAGYKINVVVYDSGTATAGQYDPAQAATNTKKLVADPTVVANLGPEMSGEGKAMTPILSEADLATITPSSTNPDITNPAMAAQFKPKGKAIYFRTVTTDAFQGPNMANFFAENLKVKSIFVLDDSGAYGVGIADSFQKQAEKIGIKVLGRDQLNPKEADYTTILTKIKALKPDALYYGGVAQAGVKLAKQAYDIIPDMIKGGGDGIQGGSFLKGGGFPASRDGIRQTRARISSRMRQHRTSSRSTSQLTKRFRTTIRSPPMTARSSSSMRSSGLLQAARKSIVRMFATQCRPPISLHCRGLFPSTRTVTSRIERSASSNTRRTTSSPKMTSFINSTISVRRHNLKHRPY